MKILLVRLRLVGDVTRMLSVAQGIRNALPDARIDFAVASMAKEVVEGHPAIDHMLVWRPPKNLLLRPLAFLQYLLKIKREMYDVAFEFYGYDLRNALVAGASCAPRRIGFARWRCRHLSHLFTNVKVDLPSTRMNRMDEFIHLVRQEAPGANALRSPITLTSQHYAEADRFWQERLDVSMPTVVIHCPVNDKRKRWPLSRFGELADRLLAQAKANVVLTWGPGQEHHVKAVLASMHRTPVLAPEFKSLKLLAAFLARADVFVGNDTGPMHIANAMGTPVIALFRGSYVMGHQPYWQPRRVLYYPLHKYRRLKKKSWVEKSGLDQIEVETVYEACLDMLALCAGRYSGKTKSAEAPPTNSTATAGQ